jgi:hypothetical protein
MVQAVKKVITVKRASGVSTGNRMGATVEIELHYEVLCMPTHI